jgi:hypothetical protein
MDAALRAAQVKHGDLKRIVLDEGAELLRREGMPEDEVQGRIQGLDDRLGETVATSPRGSTSQSEALHAVRRLRDVMTRMRMRAQLAAKEDRREDLDEVMGDEQALAERQIEKLMRMVDGPAEGDDAVAHQASVSPEQREAQRRSFVYGNVSMANPDVTREMVDEVADRAERLHATPLHLVPTGPTRRQFVAPGGGPASDHLVTSARAEVRGAHVVLSIWNRGALAGSLTLKTMAEAEAFAERFGLVEKPDED